MTQPAKRARLVPRERLGRLLTRAILQSGMTQQEVAEMVGLTDRQLRRMRRGVSSPERAVEVLRRLGWEITEMVAYTAPPPKPPAPVRRPVSEIGSELAAPARGRGKRGPKPKER